MVHALVLVWVFFCLAPFDLALSRRTSNHLSKATLWGMVPTEHRSFVDSGVCDPKSLTIEVSSALSPRFGEGQRIRIDALCRSPLSPRGCASYVSQRKDSIFSAVLLNQSRTRSGAEEEKMSENASKRKSAPALAVAKCPSGVRYFSVHLVIAAVADGSILSDHGTRKTKCVLDQLTRNVSKEQNQVRLLECVS